MRRLAALLLLAAAWPAQARADLETVHHALAVTLEPEAGMIAVRDSVSLTGGGRIALSFADGIGLDAVTLDGRPIDLERRDGRAEIDLGPPGTHVLALSYAARVPPLDEAGDGRGPRVGPAGALLPAGSGWYPEFDVDLFTYEIALDAPAPFRAVAPGRLVEEAETNGRYRARFDFPHPTDEITVFAGPWQVRERFHGGVRVRTYLDEPVADMADRYLEAVGGYLDLYARWIGPYPFSAFHVLSGPLPVGWGFPGLTYIGARVLRLPFVLERSLGHEILHNWWGNGVYIDYARGNWAEGLTTYMADHAYAVQAGPERAREMRLGWLRDYAALPAERDMPVTAFRAKLHTASQVVGYGKTAFFFHMLRDAVGEAAFDAGIRRFWTDNRFRMAGWDALRAAFEAASGRDLRPFFAQWLERPGAPDLALSEAGLGTPTEGRHRVSFALSQGAPAYGLRVPVRVATADGPESFAVEFDGPTGRFSVAPRARALSIAVDPEFDLFRRLDPAEVPPALRDVTLNAGAAVVVLAEGRDEATALDLAGRMIEGTPNKIAAGVPPPLGPLLVIGLSGPVEAYLARHHLGPTPDSIAGQGTARAWAARRPQGGPLAVVAADDGDALAALLRPLPHYGRQSFLVFDGRQAVRRGVWPAGEGPLTRVLAR